MVKLLGLLLFAAWLLRAFARNDRLELPATLIPVTILGVVVTLSYLLSPDTTVGVGKVRATSCSSSSSSWSSN